MSLTVGLCAGFGAPMASDVPGIAAQGVRLVRQELPIWEARVYRDALVAEWVGAPVRPLFLLVGAKMGHGRGTDAVPIPVASAVTLVQETLQAARDAGLESFDLEIGNEPDIAVPFYQDPRAFSELLRRVRDVARVNSFTGRIITGGIANLNQRGLDYLRRVRHAGLPPDVVIGFHRYPAVHTDYQKPHAGFRDRAEEWDVFAAETVAFGYETICTEGGCHTFESAESVQADALAFDLEFYASRGVLGYAVYQLNDAPVVRAYEDAWGIRRQDGTWKPAAAVLRAWTEAQMRVIDQSPIATGQRIAAWRPVRDGLGIAILPDGEVVSCTPYGSLETRPAGTEGPWELCQRNGDRYTFFAFENPDTAVSYTFFFSGAS
jgi:hypothetical protein